MCNIRNLLSQSCSKRHWLSQFCYVWPSQASFGAPDDPCPLPKVLEWACEHPSWTVEQWKKVTWSDKSHFSFISGVWLGACLLGEEIAGVWTMGKRQTRGDRIMLCWETGIHVSVTVASTTYLEIVTGCIHPFMAMVLLDDSGLLKQNIHTSNKRFSLDNVMLRKLGSWHSCVWYFDT